MDILAEQRRRDFCAWLRTGRRPARGGGDDLEVKFNPWHDPKDGRFTFTGAGRYYGANAITQDGVSKPSSKIVYSEDRRLPSISTREQVEAWKAAELAKYGHNPDQRKAIEEQYQRYLAKLAEKSSAEVASDASLRPDRGWSAGDRNSHSSNQAGTSKRTSTIQNISRSSHSAVQQSGRSWGGGGFTRGGGGSAGGAGASAYGFWPGGGDFGGGGASASWNASSTPGVRRSQDAGRRNADGFGNDGSTIFGKSGTNFKVSRSANASEARAFAQRRHSPLLDIHAHERNAHLQPQDTISLHLSRADLEASPATSSVKDPNAAGGIEDRDRIFQLDTQTKIHHKSQAAD